MTPWYTDDEVDDLCEGLGQNASKIRYLRSLGLHVERKPNGRPLLLRSHAELVLAGRKAAIDTEAVQHPAPRPQPNRAGLIQLFSRKPATA